MNLMKSLAVAGTVTGGALGLVIAAGAYFSGSTNPNSPAANQNVRQVITLDPIPVKLGGYGLQRKRKNSETVLLSVALTLSDRSQSARVCTLQPRLVSMTINQISNDFASGKELLSGLSGRVQTSMRHAYNRVLEAPMVGKVSVSMLRNRHEAPPSNCTETS